MYHFLLISLCLISYQFKKILMISFHSKMHTIKLLVYWFFQCFSIFLFIFLIHFLIKYFFIWLFLVPILLNNKILLFLLIIDSIFHFLIWHLIFNFPFITFLFYFLQLLLFNILISKLQFHFINYLLSLLIFKPSILFIISYDSIFQNYIIHFLFFLIIDLKTNSH